MAQCALGKIYHVGEGGVPCNNYEACRWLRLAAARGVIFAQQLLAIILAEPGTTVEVVGLKGAVHLNGAIGTVQEGVVGSGRIPVLLDDGLSTMNASAEVMFDITKEIVANPQAAESFGQFGSPEWMANTQKRAKAAVLHSRAQQAAAVKTQKILVKAIKLDNLQVVSPSKVMQLMQSISKGVLGKLADTLGSNAELSQMLRQASHSMSLPDLPQLIQHNADKVLHESKRRKKDSDA